jgi:hypothetical protein
MDLLYQLLDDEVSLPAAIRAVKEHMLDNQWF